VPPRCQLLSLELECGAGPADLRGGVLPWLDLI
jgi:hypothetical protein